MKVESKKELRERIKYLTQQNERLKYELEKEERKKWESKIEDAVKVLHRVLKNVYGSVPCMIRLEHIDKSGYWFKYQPADDNEVFSYRVGHDEV